MENRGDQRRRRIALPVACCEDSRLSARKNASATRQKKTRLQRQRLSDLEPGPRKLKPRFGRRPLATSAIPRFADSTRTPPEVREGPQERAIEALVEAYQVLETDANSQKANSQKAA
jgi:hypothetical protein